MALNGRGAKWFKKTFGAPKMPKVPTGAPTAGDMYSGPRAFSDYRPESANVRGDSGSMDAARTALGQIQEQARTGWTDTGRGQYESMLRRGQQASAATRQAALQGAQARGTAQGGAGLLAGLAGGQQDANAAADAAVGIAAQGENNRMNAMQAAGNLGMNIDAQTFGQNAATAGAMDQFNQWATGMQADAAQTGFQNQMQVYEANRQRAQAQADARRQRWQAIGNLAMGATGLGLQGMAAKRSGGSSGSAGSMGGTAAGGVAGGASAARGWTGWNG